jgi:hypothetical protein
MKNSNASFCRSAAAPPPRCLRAARWNVRAARARRGGQVALGREHSGMTGVRSGSLARPRSWTVGLLLAMDPTPDLDDGSHPAVTAPVCPPTPPQRLVAP